MQSKQTIDYGVAHRKPRSSADKAAILSFSLGLLSSTTFGVLLLAHILASMPGKGKT
jgi:hypothetical protein